MCIIVNRQIRVCKGLDDRDLLASLILVVALVLPLLVIIGL